jgi:hypothetical protein
MARSRPLKLFLGLSALGKAMRRLQLLFLCVVSTLAQAQLPSDDAKTRLIHAFRHYPIVAIGEQHWIMQAGQFYDFLVQDPDFQKAANAIVIEFASRRSQPVLDQYISGGDVPPEQLRQVWRDTTKVFAFESPIYAHLLAAIREVNIHLPPDKRLRVLAGDSGIDWATVTKHEQWERYQPNDRSFAEVINRQVLDKKKKALVILGSNHLMKTTDSHHEPTTTDLVERVHPGSMYVVAMSFRKPAQSMKIAPPVLLPWPTLVLPNGETMLVGDYADALLYLGNPPVTAEPDWASYPRDPGYLKELDRRARIEWGCGFDLQRIRDGLPHCP